MIVFNGFHMQPGGNSHARFKNIVATIVIKKSLERNASLEGGLKAGVGGKPVASVCGGVIAIYSYNVALERG